MVKSAKEADFFSILLEASGLVLNLLYAGMAWGAVAGFFGIATASGEVGVARNSAILFPGLLVLLPVTLLFKVRRFVKDTAHDPFFVVPARAYTLLGITGVAGGLGGILGFLMFASSTPTVFKKVQSNDYLRLEIGVPSVILVIVVTFVAGLVLAWWATRAKCPGQKLL